MVSQLANALTVDALRQADSPWRDSTFYASLFTARSLPLRCSVLHIPANSGAADWLTPFAFAFPVSGLQARFLAALGPP